MPTKKLINFLVKSAQIERSTGYKITALISGATLFLIFIPAMLIYFGEWFEKIIFISASNLLLNAIAYFSVSVGLFFIIWTVVTQWHIGKGTPVPIAGPKKLIVTGPYKLCRNPMWFGASLYYLGVGTYFSSLAAGVFCMIFALVFPAIYHKKVEEKELEIKFGKSYIDYKCKTPFLLPKIW